MHYPDILLRHYYFWQPERIITSNCFCFMDLTIFAISPALFCISPYLSGKCQSTARSHVSMTLSIPFLLSSNQRGYRELLAVTGSLTGGNVGQDRAIINFKISIPRSQTLHHHQIWSWEGMSLIESIYKISCLLAREYK